MFISKRCNCFSKMTGCCLKNGDLKELSKDLTVLSVKSRLEILLFLKSKPHCVCDLSAHTDSSQSLVSHHLADLIDLNLVSSKRKGKYIEYFLTKKGERIMKALESIIG